MRYINYALSNGSYREIHFGVDNENELPLVEKRKAYLENQGYTLFKQDIGCINGTLIYRKLFNK